MSHIARLEPDQILDILSYLTLQQLYSSQTVCKQWSHLYSHERLWNPVLNELKSLAGRVTQKEAYAAVISLLKSNKVMANTVMQLVASDDSLRLVLNNPPFSLEEFKGMPPLVRSLEMWRGVCIDSTGLLKSLVDGVQIVALNSFCSPNRFFVDEMGETHDSEAENIAQSRYTIMLLHLIKEPISPFNGGEMVRYLQSVPRSPVPAFNLVVDQACASIFDSHHKFPHLLAEPGFQLSE